MTRHDDALTEIAACPRCVRDALTLLDSGEGLAAKALLVRSVTVHVHVYAPVTP